MEFRFVLGGPQGGGLETAAEVLSAAFAREGYGVFIDREYFSNIKGRHSYLHGTVRADGHPRYLDYPVNLVSGLDAETVFTHFADLQPGGYLVYNSDDDDVLFTSIPSIEAELKERLAHTFKEAGVDGSVKSVANFLRNNGVRVIPISYGDLLEEAKSRIPIRPGQLSRYLSAIVVGFVAALAGISPDSLDFALKRRFGEGEIYQHNKVVAELAGSKIPERGALRPGEPSLQGGVLLATGNEVVGMAKIVAGVRFQSYYPITPAADESFFLEGHENLETGPLVVLQTEDEIAAITTAIGAALAGARAATATSGPGFDLMVEGLGWAGMNEVPVVITYYQRGGPSTGLPTRGSQSDLLSAVFASHGEFPRLVMASGDHEEAFQDVIDAFNYAERYQTPVIHLLDKFTANTVATMPLPDVERLKIDRGLWAPRGVKNYKRFELNGPISPRSALGENVMWYTGDEHDEYGHITEDPVMRRRMYEKRMAKLKLAEEEIPEGRRYAVYGSDSPKVLLVGWGFVKGAALKALERLEGEGVRAAYFHIRMFLPFPKEALRKYVEEAEVAVAVEHSYSSQAALLASMLAGVRIDRHILKYTGRPIYVGELVEGVRRVLKGESRVVLDYGH
ncbi:2-oxoacid:ferredoxin oxidoreductase subunit alpha [Pyrobaculum aerophilum]|uniref:2-oxoacid oxidoreductase (ferredoxin) n=1 Tax=Pyrobaculum aerophilum TaxID=13773 RepID=A0A832SIZ2_9CREN|nr:MULTISPECIES: 2-oxoacid:ferredoxin oxidoreductase subunit alpha [Pyrobaculum]MCX8136975.1 2-oxoacid:acceptor oxidoreductase subunit alpha [Pyrobaculum aerophilum]HII47913.1 2-oxoacid:acceptor oxidoreductase subunit alpha [Pyrobaculum aerophilum]